MAACNRWAAAPLVSDSRQKTNVTKWTSAGGECQVAIEAMEAMVVVVDDACSRTVVIEAATVAATEVVTTVDSRRRVVCQSSPEAARRSRPGSCLLPLFTWMRTAQKCSSHQRMAPVEAEAQEKEAEAPEDGVVVVTEAGAAAVVCSNKEEEGTEGTEGMETAAEETAAAVETIGKETES